MAMKINFDELDGEHHGHVPWVRTKHCIIFRWSPLRMKTSCHVQVLILVCLVQKFREETEGKAPAFRDRAAFVEVTKIACALLALTYVLWEKLKSMQKDQGEENFQQAISNLRTALMPASQHIPDDVREVLGDDKAAVTTAPQPTPPGSQPYPYFSPRPST